MLATDGSVHTASGLHNVDVKLMMRNLIEIVKAQAKAYRSKK